MKRNKEVLWSLVTLALAIISVVAVLSQSRELTFSELLVILVSGHRGWLLAAVLCMAAYILCEAVSLKYLLRHNGYKSSLYHGVTYSCADIYCSAITPSATGGQPVVMWFMKRDGVSMGVITAILMVYLIMHTFSTLTVCLISLFARADIFLGFSVFSRILIVIGYLTMSGLGVVFLWLLVAQNTIYRSGCAIIAWLKKKGWVKRDAYWRERLQNGIDEYTGSLKSMGGKGARILLMFVYLLNIVQRIAQLAVSSVMHLATGGALKDVGTIFFTQCYTAIGSMCVPIPGAMGVSDYLLYDGLNSIMDHEAALQLELLSRSVSYYILVLFSMVIVLIGYFQRKKFYFTLHRQ